MRALEFRKIICVGGHYEFQPTVLSVLACGRQPKWRGTYAFWFAAKQPEPCSGFTRVLDATEDERAALRLGVIREEIYEFEYPEYPSIDQQRYRMLAVWEALTVEELGYLPSGVPTDLSEHTAMLFTPIV